MLIGLHIFVILSVWSSVIARKKGIGFYPSIINGGVVNNPKTYPWQAYLNFDIDGFNYFCGGSLISLKYILTAAHCILDCDNPTETANGVQIRLGTVDLDRERENTTFSGKLKDCHPMYSSENPFVYDIAIIELNEPLIQFSNVIRRVRLMPEDPQDLSNFRAIATGFGTNEDGNIPRRLMATNKMKVLSTASCQTKLDAQNLGTLRDHTICTDSNNGQQTCRGDSGGPLVNKRGRKYWLVGITSNGPADCSKPPSIYTKTNYPEILDWITMTTGVMPKAYPRRSG